MPSTNLSFRTPKPLLDLIRGRDLKGVENPGATAKRDVERYYGLLAEALRDVRLMPLEVVVLIHYVGTYEGYATVSQILDAADVFRESQIGLDENFDEAQQSLAESYASLSLAARYAAWDAAERYQVLALSNKDTELTYGMALHRVGLHTYDLDPEVLAHIERMDAVDADRLPGLFLRTAEPEEIDG